MGFTIKELEALSGIKAHTIRIWEQRYHFLQPTRTPTNIRTYNNEELKTLLSVALLNKYGYKISRIDNMDEGQRAREILALQFTEAQYEHAVNRLIGCMIDLDVTGFEQLLQEHITQTGLEETISTIVFLFLEKIGILWQTGRINPAHEHVVSNIIRQKIIAGIEASQTPAATGPQLVLFLPEYEFHELGLLFVYYLLRQKGVPVIYLGANVPLKDVQYVVQAKQPQWLYLHMTSAPPRFNLQKFLGALCTDNPGCTVLLSGFLAAEKKKPAYENLQLLPSLSAVRAYIAEL